MRRHLLSLLACPVCGARLDYEGTYSGERLLQGVLHCLGCARQYQVLDELPILKDRDLSADEWSWEVDVSDLRDFDAVRSSYGAALPQGVRIAQEEIVKNILGAVRLTPGPILDVAMGMGTLFRPLAAQLASETSATGVRDCMASDVDECVLRGTQRKLRHEAGASAASLLVSDAKHLALQDAVIRAVVSFGGFGNVPRGGTALREAARVLQSGGLLVFSALLLQEDSPSHELAAEHGYAEMMSTPGVRAAVEATGLQLIKEQEFVSGRWSHCPYDLLPLEGDWFAHAVFTACKRDS